MKEIYFEYDPSSKFVAFIRLNGTEGYYLMGLVFINRSLSIPKYPEYCVSKNKKHAELFDNKEEAVICYMKHRILLGSSVWLLPRVDEKLMRMMRENKTKAGCFFPTVVENNLLRLRNPDEHQR